MREGRSLVREERNSELGEDWGAAVQARQSSRRRELEKKKLKTQQARTANEWVFDCICGVHGTNYVRANVILFRLLLTVTFHPG